MNMGKIKNFINGKITFEIKFCKIFYIHNNIYEGKMINKK